MTNPTPTEAATPAAEQLNDEFHALYDGATAHAERHAPIIVLLADSLILFRGDQRSEHRFTPARFHLLKTAAHAPVALYAIVSGLGRTDREPAEMSSALHRLADAIDRASVQIEGTSEPADDDLRPLLLATRALVAEALSGSISSARLAEAARRLGPQMLRVTAQATALQLAALDAVVDERLSLLTPEEKHGLQVVVAGAHQARQRSLGMLYFQKRFGEAPGQELRVTYAEGVEDESEAVGLVGKRRVDRALAKAFFGDAKRLQRDILGDAAAALLSTTELEAI